LEQQLQPITPEQHSPWNNVRTVVYIILAFLLFLFALDLMTSSLQHLKRNVSETILLATSNPFTGLFIGLVITAMLQSSSTTTSLVVALVASGALTLESAIPIIMGANIGTTITAAIVSLGFISKKKEFRRAVAAGTYHYFFNLLTAIILFPLEYYYGFLSAISRWITRALFTPGDVQVDQVDTHSWSGFSVVTNWLIELVNSPFILVVLAILLLFASILIFRRLISDLLKAKSPEVFSRFFFKSPFKSFSWGLLTTAAIRSSSITTSVVVPIVANKIVNLKQAAPFIMGANVGTTITAFIAAILQTNTSAAISIAIVHFLFNLIGVLLFMPIPVLRKLPIELSERLGKLTLKYRLAGFVYLLVAFFFLPFSLIYFNQDAIETLTLTYSRSEENGRSEPFTVISHMNTRTSTGEWSYYPGVEHDVETEPTLIYPVSSKNATLFIGKQMFQFTRPGFCWDGEDEYGKYKSCIEKIERRYKAAGTTFDSVYVYKREYAQSRVHRVLMSADEKIILEQEISSPQGVILREALIRIERD
jgi:sodium-dependent phosphate cotransporter